MSVEDDSNFNWVTARFECSASKQFEAMKREAKAQAEERNRQLIGSGQPSFEMRTVRNEEFLISGSRGKVVAFVLRLDHISVEDRDGNVTFKAATTLNNDGECRFKIDGNDEYKRWQVLHMALENLFFDGA